METVKKIISSDVFKFINMTIDRKVAELKCHETNVSFAASRISSYPRQIAVRTFEESENGSARNVELRYAWDQLEQIRNGLNEISKLELEIADLQRSKLRLLNDYDFTHGDNSEQVAVFGVL